MRFPTAWLLTLSALTLLAASLRAADTEEGKEAALRQLADGLHYQQGHIVLKEGLASLNVPETFRYLAATDAETLLTKIWGNPPGLAGLGMLLPAGLSPVDADSWGVIVSFREEGYVKDADAEKIDYDKLLKEMQEGVEKRNPDRTAKNYPALHLVGWAQPPRYDKETHKLYWAKELKVDGASMDTLNYDIRMLGRRGVLELSVISGINQLQQIDQAIPSLLGMVDFQEGHRYTDFNPKTDKVATYGVIGLITGGILAKAGFFKLLFAGILAAKKFIIIGLVAISSFLKKLFGKKDSPQA